MRLLRCYPPPSYRVTPASAAPKARYNPRMEIQQQAQSPSKTKGMMFRALVVDDHAGFRSSVCALLREQFPRIGLEEAGDGPEALRIIRGCATHLVLLDIRLPGGNGVALTKAIKAICASTTVVILTGNDLAEYRQAAFRNGADGFLSKGSTSCMSDVLAQVERAILARQSPP